MSVSVSYIVQYINFLMLVLHICNNQTVETGVAEYLRSMMIFLRSYDHLIFSYH